MANWKSKRSKNLTGERATAIVSTSWNRRRFVEGIAVLVIAVAAYANTLNSDFTLDDVAIVKANESIRSLGNIGKFFTTNYWGDQDTISDKSLYRPLAITSYALNYAVNGVSPRGYHAVNIGLHAGVCVLLYALVLSLFHDARMALISGILFAVHPIHTEDVAGIVGRAEIMALFGVLTCCLAYLLATRDERHGWGWVALSIGGYAFGIFSKEIGFMGPFLILLWEWILPQRRRLFRADFRAIAAFAGYAGVVLAWGGLRASAISSADVVNQGFVGTTKSEQVMTGLRVCMEYVGLLLAPIKLSADYWIPEVPFARSIWEPGVLAAIALLAGLLFVVWATWRRRPGTAWGILVFLVVLFPVSNIPFRIGVLKAERLLYSPSAGFIVGVAALAATALKRRWMQKAVRAAVVVIACLLLGRTWARNLDWRDDFTLATRTLKSSPDSPAFNFVMAEYYRDLHQDDLARGHILRCLKANPSSTWALLNLGNLEMNANRFDRAAEYFQQVLRVNPQDASALTNLGWCLEELHRYPEAADALERSRALRPDNPASYVNLLSVYIELKNVTAAMPVLEEALRRFPNVPAVHWNAGGLYLLAGRKAESEAAFRRARELDPTIDQNKPSDTLMN